jgi:hypothetical protein
MAGAPRWFIALGLLSLGSTSVVTQQQGSLADVAQKEEERRTTVTERSKVYTNADLERFERVSDSRSRSAESVRTTPTVPGEPQFGPRLSCQSEETHDEKSGDHFLVNRCSDNTTNVQASNVRTGSRWQWTVFPDGSETGIDSCGVAWTYNAKTTVYRNANGEVRFGEGAFRFRVASPTRCQAEPGQRAEEAEPAPVTATEESPALPVGLPYWVAIPGYGSVPRPRGDRRDMIENGRTGGMVWSCGDPKADPARCLENGSLRKP